MSTYQPGEPSTFTPPQDPWSGPQGVAPAPTDPIPAPPPGQFAPGVASPQPRVWSETISNQDPYGYVPQRSGGALRYVLIILVVLVLGGAGGFGAWYLITKNYPGTPQTQNTQEASPSASPTASQPAAFDPADVRVGDCLVNRGTATQTEMAIAPCDTAGSYKVLKIIPGPDIPNELRPLTPQERAAAAAPVLCPGTGYTAFFAWDHPDDALDFYFCLDTN